jgi:hypothetical protein
VRPREEQGIKRHKRIKRIKRTKQNKKQKREIFFIALLLIAKTNKIEYSLGYIDRTPNNNNHSKDVNNNYR